MRRFLFDRRKRLSHLLFVLVTTGLAFADDKATFEKVCGACHSFTLISDLKSQSEWAETVEYMVAHGAKGSPEQLAAVMRHLGRNFTRVNVNEAEASEIALALGVSDSQAQAVVDHRTAHGKFTSVTELKKLLPPAKVDSRKDRIAFQ